MTLKKVASQILVTLFALPTFLGLVSPIAQVAYAAPHYKPSQSVDKEFAKRGDTLNYTITIINDGTTDLTSVFATEHFSNYVTYVNGSTTATKGSQTVNVTDAWTADGVNLGKLTPGQTVTVSLQATVNQSAPDNAFIETTAQVKTNEFPNWIQCAAVTRLKKQPTPEPKNPHFKPSKQVDKAKAKPGDTLTYTINVLNDGDIPLTSVFVVDNMPAEVNYVAGSTSVTKGVVTVDVTDAWLTDGANLGTLAVGQTGRLSFNAVIKEDVEDWVKIENVAQVKTNELPNWVQCAANTMVEFEKGQPERGSLKIFKFEDSNGDAALTDGEKGLSGFEFTIKGNGIEKTVTTGSDGVVVVGDLEPGTYTVSETIPAGWRITTDNNIKVTVKSGETTEVRFGNKQVGKVLGKITQLPDTGPGLILVLLGASVPAGIYLRRLKKII